MAKRIIYHPPSRQAIEAYARKACEKLAERDVSYLSPEVVSGFAQFLQLTSTIWAKHLTAESEMEHKLDTTAN